jgi:E3 ubiquitin-protein ligase TRIP12
VTSENVEEYIAEVLEAILGQGARLQAKAFREGFSKVFPITDLQAFTLDELVMLFGNAEEDWSIESERLVSHGNTQTSNSCLALNEAIKADHGFNVESRTIRNLVDMMSEFDVPMRRHYLQFLTGSPKLPIGG